MMAVVLAVNGPTQADAIRVYCDGCGAPGACSLEDAEDVEKAARAAGWSVHDDRDLCPTCRQPPPPPEGATP